MSSVSAGTQQIADLVREAAAAIANLAAVAEENAASAQEMAALSEQVEATMTRIATLAEGGEAHAEASLAGLARQLRALVASFRIEDAAPRSQPPEETVAAA